MFSNCLTKILLPLVLISGFGLSTLAAAPAPSSFRICAEPDNLPMSQQSSRSGFEIEIARLLAKDMGQELQVKWVAQRDHSFFRQTIGTGACDAIMGIPSGFSKLTTTKPVYRTGFFFVTRPEDNLAPKSFDDENLRKLKIGVPVTGLGDTPPALALTRRGLGENLRPYSIYEPQKLISAVVKKDVDMAILWGAFAGWFSSNEKPPLTITQTPVKDNVMPLAFDISIGVRKGNTALAELLNLALDHQQAGITAILNHWHVPVVKD